MHYTAVEKVDGDDDEKQLSGYRHTTPVLIHDPSTAPFDDDNESERTHANDHRGNVGVANVIQDE